MKFFRKLWSPTPTDPSFADKLFAKRAKLNQQVARGDITLEEAEAALGRWYDKHAPDA